MFFRMVIHTGEIKGDWDQWWRRQRREMIYECMINADLGQDTMGQYMTIYLYNSNDKRRSYPWFDFGMGPIMWCWSIPLNMVNTCKNKYRYLPGFVIKGDILKKYLRKANNSHQKMLDHIVCCHRSLASTDSRDKIPHDIY